MFSYFLKVTLRNLWRNKLYSIISLVGLAVGISSCILISIYVLNELNFDQHHEKKDRIYRLTSKLNFNGEINAALTNLPSGPTLMQEYPEVESYVRFQSAGPEMEFSSEGKLFKESNIWFTDSTIFQIFSFNVLEGEPQEALKAAQSIVLTKSLANKLFGNENALGKQVKGNNSYYNVTAVIEDIPQNSEMQINALISISTLPPGYHQSRNQDWFRIGLYTFLLFNEPQHIETFDDKLVDFEKKYVQPWSEQNDIVASLEYHITPLAKVHFDEGREYDLPKGNITYIYLFSALAIFLLLIAVINYINLNLAQSNKRSKEVGVRKTLGASKFALGAQFLGESFFITFMATLLSIGLVAFFLPGFNDLTNKNFVFFEILNVQSLIFITLVFVIVGSLSGLYPALVLSSQSAIAVIKGNLKLTNAGVLRKVLILVQFVFSLFMIATTLMIGDQMEYLRQVNLGFDQENIITLRLPNDTSIIRRAQPWVQELRNDSRVKTISQSSLPTGGGTGEIMFRIEKEGKMIEQTVNMLFVDEDFIGVLGLDTLYGRNFKRSIQSDIQSSFIVNETALKHWGWQNEPLGKRIQWGLQPNGAATYDGQVIGVVNDFNFVSLHNKIQPLILCFNPNGNNNLTIKLNKGDYTIFLSSLEEKWIELAPSYPFDFQFYDDILQRNYRSEVQMHKVFNFFALISIILASLGLFALLSFSIESRVKEIGIRKTLGASLTEVVWLLSKDFAYLMLIAFILIVPVVVILMNRWLEEFAYATPIQALSFLTTILIALLLTGVSVAYHTYSIAKLNPVDALRDE